MNVETKDFYKQIYQEKGKVHLGWTAGTANPEIINLVYEGVIPVGSKILEIGCGLGSESVFMAARGMDVTALDISEAAVNRGKQIADAYGIHVNWIAADLLETDLFNEDFDILTDQGCFHHMHENERELYMKKVVKYLKPGGMFILRSFSDKIPGGPQPRRVSSDDMISTFHKHFKLEHMERILSFSSERYEKPISWFTIWYKR
jgi:cyclopropane fatty-acyl-phospholipid synthase-like methyltransferase